MNVLFKHVELFSSTQYITTVTHNSKLWGEFGETNVICQYFTQSNSRFTTVSKC